MTPARYRAYRRALEALQLVAEDLLDPAEHALLRDAAEGLLLARDSERDEAEDLRLKAALALSLLVGSRRCPDELADDLWARLLACGPGGRTNRIEFRQRMPLAGVLPGSS